MSALAAMLLLALSRAEMLERFRAPVVTQSEGLVRVFSDCPEDMRREYQMPVARFAADTVDNLYKGLSMRPLRFKRAGIAIYVGDVRTNDSSVVARAFTNDSGVVTRIYLRAPGFSDLGRLRVEVAKGFFRSVKGTEVSDADAIAAYRAGDPALRVEDERLRLEEWLATGKGVADDEEGLKLLRKVIQPGVASRRDILTFAARLYFYPPQQDLRFAGKYDILSFADAIKLAPSVPALRTLARRKAMEVTAFGGGRGAELTTAATAYAIFLIELSKGEKGESELRTLLDISDALLNVAYEKSEGRKTGSS